MEYWKSKVLPKIKKVFEKDGAKKAAAAEACKSFDASKEDISKEFEEKKTELQPKVLEIYEASSTEIKTLVKEPNEAGLKKHSALVQKFLDELAKIEFPGSKAVTEVTTKYGAGYVSGPVFFIFEKVSTLIVVEEKTRDVEAPGEEKKEEEKKKEEATSESKEKEIVIEEEKKEKVVAVEAEKKEEETKPAEAEATPPPAEPVKTDEAEPSKP